MSCRSTSRTAFAGRAAGVLSRVAFRRLAGLAPPAGLTALVLLPIAVLSGCGGAGGANAREEAGRDEEPDHDSVSAALEAEMARFPERHAEEPVPLVDVAEVRTLLARDADVVLVDAREPEAYARGHLPGALNYPYGNWLEEGLPLPPRDRDVIVYCNSQDCPIGRLWAEQAVQRGYTRVRHMKAGLAGWREAGLPVETDSDTAPGAQEREPAARSGADAPRAPGREATGARAQV